MSAEGPPPKSVLGWVVSLYVLVLAMVAVGGITRLTGSGLSMVEWQPLIGAIPPLDAKDWDAVFTQYQASPQYLQVNHWMQLEDFKRIFLWEYLHRLLGRLIGLAFSLPWLYFVLRGRLRGRMAWMSLGAFVLGGLQGALGWFMVQSGLVDVPAVSHLRLAAHLSLAFFVGMWLLWIALDLTSPRHVGAKHNRLTGWAWALVAVLALQIVYGAFMAGTRAGYLFQTYPTMNGTWLAPGWLSLSPWTRNLVENVATIHTLHRHLAWVVLLSFAGFVAWAWPRARARAERQLLGLLLGATVLQLVLGALTVMTGVQIAIAVVHQSLAYLLLSLLIAVIHRLRTVDSAAGRG